MKLNEKQATLDHSLSFLNEQLYKGYLIKTHFLDLYRVGSKEKGFSLDKLQKKYEKSINKWLELVASHLFDNFEKHLYFHFIQPKDDAMSYTHPLGKLTHALNKRLYALEDVIVRIEERKNLAVRQEIAEKELESDILYKISFSWHTREIKLNNILISRPNSDSKNLNFFEYVYGHSNEQIKVKEIEKTTAHTLSNNIQDILRDLGFKGNVRKLFFPIATKSKVMFVNPISKQYAIKNDLPTIKLPR